MLQHCWIVRSITELVKMSMFGVYKICAHEFFVSGYTLTIPA